jgi:hypothetical protein
MNGTTAAIIIIALIVIGGGAYALTRPHGDVMMQDSGAMHDAATQGDSMQGDAAHDSIATSSDAMMDAGMQMEASGTMMAQ